MTLDEMREPRMEPISKPIRMKFEGFDADQHLIEAYQLGRSMSGVGRIYTAAYHFYLLGEMPKNLRTPEVRVMAGPLEQSSLSYAIWMLLQHGRLAAYPELLFEFIDYFIPDFVKAAVASKSGQEKIAEEAIKSMASMAEGNTELARRAIDFAKTVEQNRHEEVMARHEDSMARHEEVMAAIDSGRVTSGVIRVLVDHFGSIKAGNMIEMVEPVGRSARRLTHAKDTPSELAIEESAAEVIRSRGNLELDDTRSMIVRLGAVDTIARTCKILIDGERKPIKGRIADPAIVEPHNVYTKALDAAEAIVITGKMGKKDGKAIVFFIDAARSLLHE